MSVSAGPRVRKSSTVSARDSTGSSRLPGVTRYPVPEAIRRACLPILRIGSVSIHERTFRLDAAASQAFSARASAGWSALRAAAGSGPVSAMLNL